mgnify:CR=1 FL=1
MATLALFLAVFVVQRLVRVVAGGVTMQSLFALTTPVTANPWTVLTSVYAHGSLSHLLANAVALAFVGVLLERETTPARFHAFVLVTGALSGLAEVWLAATVGSVAGREIRVPVVDFNVEYVTALDLGDEYGDVERVVYERLARLAEGNPGVALELWADAAADGEISPAELDERDDPLDLDDDEAFALTTVLCKERLSYDALDRLLDDVDVARAVQTLAYHDLVTVDDDDVVSVTPERFHAAVEHLEGRRYLW